MLGGIGGNELFYIAIMNGVFNSFVNKKKTQHTTVKEDEILLDCFFLFC